MRPLTSDERGAVAVLVALLLVALMGFGALVLDVAALVQEKRELQNGADAAALAIAKDCSGASGCGAFDATAEELADANADDGASTVGEVCGTGAGLPACAEPPTVAAGKYVQVRTSTDNPANTADASQIGFVLAPVLNAANVGATVHAKSVVAWGGPASLQAGLPLTISMCEWLSYTSDGSSFPPAGPYPPYPAASWERTIYLHDTTGASPCPAGPSGADLPGGFGWLDTSQPEIGDSDTGDGCKAYSGTDGWWDDKTGRPPPQSCTAALMRTLLGKVVYLPIFVETNGLTGTNGEYRMGGFAAFLLTGYSIEGQYKERSIINGAFPCSGQASCVSGMFLEVLASEIAGTIGGDDLGLTIIAFSE